MREEAIWWPRPPEAAAARADRGLAARTAAGAQSVLPVGAAATALLSSVCFISISERRFRCYTKAYLFLQ